MSRTSPRPTWQGLLAKIEACTLCPLHKGATRAVPGEGPHPAPLLLIGEAPGAREDLLGLPFQGAAGKLLNQLLADAHIPRGSVFITNLVKHRPPQNRAPRRVEVNACAPYLDSQIQLINPALILTLGIHALTALGPDLPPLAQSHGQLFAYRQLHLVPLYHPAAALYSRALLPTLIADLQKVKSYLDDFGLQLTTADN